MPIQYNIIPFRYFVYTVLPASNYFTMLNFSRILFFAFVASVLVHEGIIGSTYTYTSYMIYIYLIDFVIYNNMN